MGKSRSKKQLTPGQLRSRGWTKSLMNTLLPKPRYRHFNGRSMPVWEREDVQAAEATETFQKQNLGAKPQGEAGRAAQQAAHRGDSQGKNPDDQNNDHSGRRTTAWPGRWRGITTGPCSTTCPPPPVGACCVPPRSRATWAASWGWKSAVTAWPCPAS